jgi:hypothetical protein
MSRDAKLRSAFSHGMMNAGRHFVFPTAQHTGAALNFLIERSEITVSQTARKCQIGVWSIAITIFATAQEIIIFILKSMGAIQ